MMKISILPPRATWPELCRRPVIDKASHDIIVRRIIETIRSNGDNALKDYSARFDGFVPESFRVSRSLIEDSVNNITEELKSAIRIACENITKFHSSQLRDDPVVETMPGVSCWRKSVPIEKVGLYIPGGSAPLFSTVLMLAIPAKLAGCSQIVLTTPPCKDGSVNPVILYAALIAGVTDVFCIGGAQAIAALAFGTESIPRVDKIFGPGNQYVTRAKELIQTEGIPIDMPAGPSEVLVIADKEADPDFIAADLLSQAEHGDDSQVILLTDNSSLIDNVMASVEKQLPALSRNETASRSLENSIAICLESIDDCFSFSNIYAPEHLIISVADMYGAEKKIKNAGSVFLGKYSCESAGDYATGTNHTLPTNGFARNFSGVSTESFMKKITFQHVTDEGIRNIGPAVGLMARAENLDAHANAVTIRLNKLIND